MPVAVNFREASRFADSPERTRVDIRRREPLGPALLGDRTGYMPDAILRVDVDTVRMCLERSAGIM